MSAKTIETSAVSSDERVKKEREMRDFFGSACP